MLQGAISTVRRRSASFLAHNEGDSLTSPLPCPDFQWKSPSIENLNSVGEQVVEINSEGWPGEGHASYHQDSDRPPIFNDLRRSSSATESKHSDDFQTSVRTNYPSLLPSGKLKFTNKWPTPSALKYLSYQSDDPGPTVPSLEHGQGPTLPRSGRWTLSKVLLFLSCMTVFAYGTTFLLWASVTWFDAWAHADVMVVADHDILVLITVGAALLVFCSMLGISGAMLNSRPLLAIYTLLLWPDQAIILAVGYVAYKRVTFNFDRKMSFAWSHLYTVPGRQIIQDSFGCCGFYNTMHDAAPSKRCYLRASIPGCRDSLFEFERTKLALVWKVAFALAALHILNMVIALLCSNHVSDRFGKGLTPQRYRLCSDDIRADSKRGVAIEIKSDGHHILQDRHSKGEVHYVD